MSSSSTSSSGGGGARVVLKPRAVPAIYNGKPDIAFEWPDLEVRRSRQGHASFNLGVFARRSIPAGAILEVLGRRLDPSPLMGSGSGNGDGRRTPFHALLEQVFSHWFAQSSEAGTYYPHYTHTILQQRSSSSSDHGGEWEGESANESSRSSSRRAAASRSSSRMGRGRGRRRKRKLNSGDGNGNGNGDGYDYDYDYDEDDGDGSTASEATSSRQRQRRRQRHMILAFPGLPGTFSWQQVGGRGLWIAAMIAAPKRAIPNCAFIDNYVVTLTAIAAGDELLVAFVPDEESVDETSGNGYTRSRDDLNRVVKAGLRASPYPPFSGLEPGILSQTFSNLLLLQGQRVRDVLQLELDAVLSIGGGGDDAAAEEKEEVVERPLSEFSYELQDIRAQQPFSPAAFRRFKESTITLPRSPQANRQFIALLAAVKRRWRGRTARDALSVGLRVLPSEYLRSRGIESNLNGLYNTLRPIAAGEIIGFYDGIFSARSPRSVADSNYSFTVNRDIEQDEGGGYLVLDSNRLPPEEALLNMRTHFPADVVGDAEANPIATDSWGPPGGVPPERFRPPLQWHVTSPVDEPMLGAQINTCGVGTADCYERQNVQFVLIFFDLFIVAIRPIGPGEELLGDYKDLLQDQFKDDTNGAAAAAAAAAATTSSSNDAKQQQQYEYYTNNNNTSRSGYHASSRARAHNRQV